ncbi:MAG: diaminopimelate epimerase [Pyrinomonadaceae bacterium]
MTPRFTKFHGLGNDYLVIESAQLGSDIDLAEFSKRICDRHYGAGGDGIALVAPVISDDADYNVRIFNPDGSEAGLSGNGTRCAAAYLRYHGLWSDTELRLSTRTGIKRYLLREEIRKGKYVFDSELGNPKLDPAEIPMTVDSNIDTVVGYPLKVQMETVLVTALQMGNPNCCILVNNFSDLDWRSLGAAIETHNQFPDRTNVVFVRVPDRRTVELRIWERGVGETTASGTCSCAGAVAAMINGRTDRQVTAVMPGGQVQITWRDDDEVVITGSAEVVYSAEWLGS